MSNNQTIQFITGETITFLKTTEETNGEYLLLRVELPSNKGNGLHYHPTYEETFTCIEGQLEITLGNQIVNLNPGETATAPKLAKHKFWNRTKQNVIFEVEITPARYQESFFRIVNGLVLDGKTYKNGLPKNIWHTVLLFELFETYPAPLPSSLLNKFFNPLIRLAKKRGLHKQLNEYTPEYSHEKRANKI